MGDAGRRPDSKAQGQGAPPLPLPQQRQGADMHKVIFFSHLDQTNTAPCNTTCSWKVRGEQDYGLLLQLLLGAVCAGQWGEPRECPGVSSSHKAPQGHLLAEGNHNSQGASTGTHLSLGARSTTFQTQFKYLKYHGKTFSVYFLCRRWTTVVSH